ncbi:helix-turn-helix domain-containing protein [Paenibacillus lentus]|uniref:XRE family transcriptional regulator n=1 Tax=Paenibacillus lentus TaxID=1338368 RepID=A0A3S8RPC7_9BACL|nr:helix-turn-helix transcriptional regulator [Paenibacillus lentus]AZK44800.1 XRE family transcriptional regulator [Paenibacillus lentus]
MNFAERLKSIMEEKNMSQTELSDLTGIGKSSISQYLSGKNEPNQKRIEKFADALNCSTAYLNGITTCSDPTDNPNGLKNIPVAEAAKRLGKSKQFIRVGLQKQILPFGVAVQLSSKFSYHISPKLLDDYIGK